MEYYTSSGQSLYFLRLLILTLFLHKSKLIFQTLRLFLHLYILIYYHYHIILSKLPSLYLCVAVYVVAQTVLSTRYSLFLFIIPQFNIQRLFTVLRETLHASQRFDHGVKKQKTKHPMIYLRMAKCHIQKYHNIAS